MLVVLLALCFFVTRINGNAINQTLTTPTVKVKNNLEVKDDKVANTLQQFASPMDLNSHKNLVAPVTLDELFSEGGKVPMHKNKSIVPRKGVEYPKNESNQELVDTPNASSDILLAGNNTSTELKHENQILKSITSTNIPNITLTTTTITSAAAVLVNKTDVKTLNTSATQEVSLNSSTITKTTTTTASTTTRTKTTPKPKKPQVALSPQDDPSLLNVPEFKPPLPSLNNKLSVEEPLPPIAQATKEYVQAQHSIPPKPSGAGHREYIVPFILMIFAIPMILGAFVVSYRKFKDWWLTRHYRRMDFLVDGMYND
jgi:hypothetical protein